MNCLEKSAAAFKIKGQGINRGYKITINTPARNNNKTCFPLVEWYLNVNRSN